MLPGRACGHGQGRVESGGWGVGEAGSAGLLQPPVPPHLVLSLHHLFLLDLGDIMPHPTHNLNHQKTETEGGGLVSDFPSPKHDFRFCQVDT